MEEGQVEAHVQGSRADPYDVRLEVKTLTAEHWSRLGTTLAGEALFVAKLLASEMPPDIEEAFCAAGLRFFRSAARTCGPRARVRLRGLDREGLVRLVGRLPARPRTETDTASTASSQQPLSAVPEDFWKGGDLPEGVLGDAQPPPVSAALVRRLGRFPFWRGREPLLEAIVPVYEAASALGVEVFLGEPRRRDSR